MLGAHVIFGAYGFWLPNDPRGSWSTFVGSYELYRYGRATKTTERRSLAYDSHDRELRLAAKSALQRPAISFNDAQIEAIAAGIGEYVWKSRTHVWALAILRDHVHAVIAASTVNVKQRVNLIKGAATRELILCGIHPFQDLARRRWSSQVLRARRVEGVFRSTARYRPLRSLRRSEPRKRGASTAALAVRP
jgi:REP element-mobilizing transposase RayT